MPISYKFHFWWQCNFIFFTLSFHNCKAVQITLLHIYLTKHLIFSINVHRAPRVRFTVFIGPRLFVTFAPMWSVFLCLPSSKHRRITVILYMLNVNRCKFIVVELVIAISEGFISLCIKFHQVTSTLLLNLKASICFMNITQAYFILIIRKQNLLLPDHFLRYFVTWKCMMEVTFMFLPVKHSKRCGENKSFVI